MGQLTIHIWLDLWPPLNYQIEKYCWTSALQIPVLSGGRLASVNQGQSWPKKGPGR